MVFYHYLQSYKAIKAENKRLLELQKKFNRISARWSHVKREANIIYLAWSNKMLEKQSTDADWELLQIDLETHELNMSIDKIVRKRKKIVDQLKIHRERNMTGNGSLGGGSGTTPSTQGTQ